MRFQQTEQLSLTVCWLGPPILRNSNDVGTFGVILDLFASYIRLGLAPGASSEYEPEQRTVEDEFPHQKYLNPIFIHFWKQLIRPHWGFILYGQRTLRKLWHKIPFQICYLRYLLSIKHQEGSISMSRVYVTIRAIIIIFPCPGARYCPAAQSLRWAAPGRVAAKSTLTIDHHIKGLKIPDDLKSWHP